MGTHIDLSLIKYALPEENDFWKNIEKIFPIISTADALKSTCFKAAFEAQKNMYGILREQHDVTVAQVEGCITAYERISETTVHAEAEANELSLFLLTMLLNLHDCDSNRDSHKSLPDDLIAKVKPSYKELLDYYLALRLICIPFNNEEGIYPELGDELMLSLAECGNKYAREYMKLRDKQNLY